jgi:sortase (surface protein transpeptidase)
MLLLGGLLILAAGYYYAYGFFATRDVNNLVADTGDGDEILDGPTRTSSKELSAARQELYPGSLLPARQWADPRGTIALTAPSLQGFVPLSNIGQPLIAGSVGRGQRIIVPQLEIDATIEELTVVNLQVSAEYHTPKFTVGHIPTTPNPGSSGNGWYFGHLETPIDGEGNVFSRLPQVPALLRDGEDVHVVLRTASRDYLYLVKETTSFHEDDLKLYPSDDARITLVTCYPRLHYDHRLLVTAQLIGFRDEAPIEGENAFSNDR